MPNSRKQIINRFLQSTENSVRWLLRFSQSKEATLEDYKPLLSSIRVVMHTRGLISGIQFVKTVRGNLLNYLSGNPERIKGVRLTNLDGLPTCLGPLIKYIRQGHIGEIRMTMTILFSTRSLRLESNPDIEPIIGPLKKGTSYDGISMFAGSFWRELGYRKRGTLPRLLRWRRFHFTTKSGPNGHALSTWAIDLFRLPSPLVRDLKVLGGSKFSDFVDQALVSRDLIHEWISPTWKKTRGTVSPIPLASTYERLILYFQQKTTSYNDYVSHWRWQNWFFSTENQPVSPFRFTSYMGQRCEALWIVFFSLVVSLGKKSLQFVFGQKVTHYLSHRLDIPMGKGCYVPHPDKFRKLSYFPDREGKTRVIAIGDYFTQTVLKGLHTWLFKVLKRIPQDCTFDQASFRTKLGNCDWYYSVDLTAATDRFPIEVICLVLSAYLPKSYVDSWKRVMVGYPFPYKGTEVSYSVGNPMGFYSSWASFALAHHYVVYYCCRILGKDWHQLKYCLLGDDIVIGDREVGEKYLEVIKSLGVEVSMAKSHKSQHTYEFAKRWIHKQQEISPFPVSALKESQKNSYSMGVLLADQQRKGWVFTEGVDSLVSFFYGCFKTYPSRLRKVFSEHAIIGEQIALAIWGAQTAGISITNISRYLGYHLPPINDAVGQSILCNIAVEAFSESREVIDSKKGKPLGLLAEQIVLNLTGLDDTRAWTLLENPILHAYGSIESNYLDAIKEARRIDTVGGGNWPAFLRSLAVPLSDEIFVTRQDLATTVGISKVGRKLKDRLEILSQYPQMLE